MNGIVSVFLILLFPIVSQNVGESKDSIGISDLLSIINVWSVDETENTQVRYKIIYLDELGNSMEGNQTEVTHILYEGEICVKESRNVVNGQPDRYTRWSNGAAVRWLDVQPDKQRGYAVDHKLKPGSGALLGFMFSGFGDLDTEANLLAFSYPHRTHRVKLVTHEEEEISVTLDSPEDNYKIQMVMVFGAKDNRIRRLETWILKEGKTEMTQILVAEFSNWSSDNGRIRPNTLTFRPPNKLAGTRYEFIEMLPSTENDLATIPPSRPGDRLVDNRVGFIGEVGSTKFSLEGLSYSSSVPISGPPLNYEEIMSEAVHLAPPKTQHQDHQTINGIWTSRLIYPLVFVCISALVWVLLRKFR